MVTYNIIAPCLLLEHETGEAARLEALRDAMLVGIAQLTAGDFEEVRMEDLEQYLERL